MRRYENLLLHIPHASTAMPAGVLNTTLDEEEQLLIDYYTDELFMPDEESARIEVVVFPYCRLFCDVERLPDDPLEARGLGISHERRTADGQLRTFGSKQDAYKTYDRYHCDVVTQITDKRLPLLLIDCHSFSAHPNLLVANPPQDIDICIGYNDDVTRPEQAVIDAIHYYFISRGYRVGINTPFSNSKTFDVPGGNNYHSVMIEVNKSVYMNEETQKKTEGFHRLHADLQTLYSFLLRSV